MPVRLGPRPGVLAGREGLLAQVAARLADGDGQAGPRVVALCGLGGAGKTSVAVEYAYRHVAEVGVCWQFAAEDPTVLRAQFAELAAQLGAREPLDVRDPVASVHAVLARAGTGWLLVFDNVISPASVQRFVPPAGRGRVLITTQNQHWPPAVALEVPVLDTEVAAGFLVSRTGDPDRAAARELAVALGGLPLALEQAAAYMQATGTALARYLPLFRARQADLLTRGQAAGHPEHVAATLGLGLSRLAQEAPGAVAVLRLLAFLAPEPVPLGVLLGDSDPADPAVAATVGPLAGDVLAVGRCGRGAARLFAGVAGRGRAGAGAPPGAGHHPRSPARRPGRAMAAGRRRPDPSRGPRRPATAGELAGVHGAAAARPGRPGPDQRRHVGIAQALGYSGSYLAARDLFQQITTAHEQDACLRS